MTDNPTNDAPGTAAPAADLANLDLLVGTWKLSGDTEGTVTYEWMDGGFFLLQRVDMKLFGHQVKALEVIGHLQPFGEDPSTDIRSRAYDSSGNTLDYVYDLQDGTLTIWGGERGSPAYFTGTFSDDGNTNVGKWVYPDGGGYRSDMTRLQQRRRVTS